MHDSEEAIFGTRLTEILVARVTGATEPTAMEATSTSAVASG